MKDPYQTRNWKAKNFEGRVKMSDIKIEDLRIGQTVWYAKEKYTISILSHLPGKEPFIGVIENENIGLIPENISLAPPRKNKRFWLWSIKNDNWYKITTYWYKITTYLDDNGLDTDGDKYQSEEDWEVCEKIKHENEYIDIEIDW